MSLEAWGDEGDIGPEGYVTEEVYQELEAERDRLKQHVADLQSGMYVNCVYCGHRYGPTECTPVSKADVLKAHVEVCPEHPMSELRASLELEKFFRENNCRERDEWKAKALAAATLTADEQKYIDAALNTQFNLDAPVRQEGGRWVAIARFLAHALGDRSTLLSIVKELKERLAEAESARDMNLDTCKRLEARASSAESALAQLKGALRKLAIVEHVRPTHTGRSIHNGYSCQICRAESEAGAPLVHKAECLAAPPQEERTA